MTTRDEIEELKAATRAAHETVKDLNKAIRVGEKLVEALKVEAEKQVNDQVRPVIQKGLDEFATSLKAAIAEGTAGVYKRFETITDILLHEAETDRRKGEPSLQALAQELMAPPPGVGLPQQTTKEYRYENGQPLSRRDRRRTKR